ncbi:MAG: hypothetical protein WC350_03190 [Candidatus Micrarchaeia archaeon]|jgi:hypothetical protein
MPQGTQEVGGAQASRGRQSELELTRQQGFTVYGPVNLPNYGEIYIASKDICVSPQELRDYAYRVLFPESSESDPSERIRFFRSGETNRTYIAIEEVREIFRKMDWDAIQMSEGNITFPDFNSEQQFVERRDFGNRPAPSPAPVSAAPQLAAKRAEAEATSEGGIPYLTREPNAEDASHIIWGDQTAMIGSQSRSQPSELVQLQREYFGLKTDATFYWRSRNTEGYTAIYFNFISPEGEAQDTARLAQELAETQGDITALMGFVQKYRENIADVSVESSRGAGAGLTAEQFLTTLASMAGLEPAVAATAEPSAYGAKAALSSGIVAERAAEYGAQVIAAPGDNVMASFPSVTYSLRDGRTGTLDGYFTITLPTDELEAWKVLVDLQRIARALERGEPINAPLQDLLTNYRDSINFIEMQDSNGTRLNGSMILYRLQE